MKKNLLRIVSFLVSILVIFLCLSYISVFEKEKEFSSISSEEEVEIENGKEVGEGVKRDGKEEEREEEKPRIFKIGKTDPSYVIAEFNEDFSEVRIYKNGDNSDGIMNDWRVFDNDENSSGVMRSWKMLGDIQLVSRSPMELNDTTLTSVIIEEGITEIGENAFCNCSGLTSVVIPEGVTRVGDMAFGNCSNLESITIPGSIEAISDWGFSTCKRLKKLHIIDLVAWCNIDFSDELAYNPLSYGVDLYVDDEVVKNLVIPEGVTIIGPHAFDSYKTLESVVLPEGVENISSFAFHNCEGLTSVIVPSTLTEVGANAFWNCENLKDVYITDFAAWCNINFANVFANPLIRNGNLYINEELTQTVVIPAGVTKISPYAFRGCDTLENVELPSNVTSIGNNAFEYCRNLKSVIVSDELTDIGENAFRGCKNLSSITLGEGITNIGEKAFAYCGELSVHYSGTKDQRGSITFGSDWNFEICERR